MVARRSIHIWLAGLAFASILAVTAVLLLQAADKRASNAGRAIAHLQKEVAALRESRNTTAGGTPRDNPAFQDLLRRQSASPQAEPAAASPPPHDSAGRQEEPLTPEENDYRTGVIIAANDKLLGTAYAEESTDPTWAAAAAASLNAAYVGPDFEALSTQVECRATLCRVSFSFAPDSDGAAKWRAMLYRTPWPAGARATVDAPAGKGTMYVSREGHDLPNVDHATLQF